MALATTFAIVKPLAAVGAVALVGMGGYNFATSGCFLGSCDSSAANTTLTADAGAVKDSCCPIGETAETTELVSLDAAEGCTEAMKAACESMGGCPEAMMEHCGDKSECPTGDAATTSLVADESACEKTCDGEASTASLVADVDEAACEKTCDGEAGTASLVADVDEAACEKTCDGEAGTASLVADVDEAECEKSCETECTDEAEQTAEAETADETVEG